MFSGCETGHIGIFDQIGTVFVIIGRRNENADLMQQCAPVQQFEKLVGIGIHLLVYGQRIIRDPNGTLLIDMITLEHFPDRFFPTVFLGRHQIDVPHDPHPQTGLDRFQHLNSEIFHQYDQNGQSPQNRRSAFSLDPVKFYLIETAGPNHFHLQPFEILKSETAIADPVDGKNFCCGTYGSGRTIDLRPATGPVIIDSILELASGGQHGSLKRCLINNAIMKKRKTLANGTDTERFNPFDFLSLAANQFCRSPADIDYKPFFFRTPEHIGHTQINQSPFLFPRNHFNRITEHLLGIIQKNLCIGSDTERIRGDDLDLRKRIGIQNGAQTFQRIQSPVHRLSGQNIVSVQSRRETVRFTRTLDHADDTVDVFTNMQTKTVGTEIYCSKHSDAF